MLDLTPKDHYTAHNILIDWYVAIASIRDFAEHPDPEKLREDFAAAAVNVGKRLVEIKAATGMPKVVDELMIDTEDMLRIVSDSNGQAMLFALGTDITEIFKDFHVITMSQKHHHDEIMSRFTSGHHFGKPGGMG